jgi:hypothetical protein
MENAEKSEILSRKKRQKLATNAEKSEILVRKKRQKLATNARMSDSNIEPCFSDHHSHQPKPNRVMVRTCQGVEMRDLGSIL